MHSSARKALYCRFTVLVTTKVCTICPNVVRRLVHVKSVFRLQGLCWVNSVNQIKGLLIFRLRGLCWANSVNKIKGFFFFLSLFFLSLFFSLVLNKQSFLEGKGTVIASQILWIMLKIDSTCSFSEWWKLSEIMDTSEFVILLSSNFQVIGCFIINNNRGG